MSWEEIKRHKGEKEQAVLVMACFFEMNELLKVEFFHRTKEFQNKEFDFSASLLLTSTRT